MARVDDRGQPPRQPGPRPLLRGRVAALELSRRKTPMRFSRRDVLKGLGALAAGGVPATAGGAAHRGLDRRRRPRPRPSSPRTGTRGPDSWERASVVIVGAGVAGLSAAWALDRAGVGDFLVLELEDAAGRDGALRSRRGHALSVGRALRPRSRSRATARWWRCSRRRAPSPAAIPRAGPSTRKTSSAATRRSACSSAASGTKASTRAWPPPRRTSPSWPRFEADMRRWAGWRDARGRRAFDLPRARGTDAGGDPRPRRAVDGPLPARPRLGIGAAALVRRVRCRDDFGATLAQTSAWAGIHYFAARLGDSGHAADFLTWPEGNGRLVSRLAGRAGRPAAHAGHGPPCDPARTRSRRRLPRRARGPPARHPRRARGPRPAPLPRRLRRGRRAASRGRRRLRLVDGREPDPARPSRVPRLSAGVGQRPLRQPVPRLRRGHAPAGPRPRADGVHVLPAAARRRPAHRAAAAAGHAVGGVGRGDPRRPGAGPRRPRGPASRRWTSISGATRWSARSRDPCGASPWPTPPARWDAFTSRTPTSPAWRCSRRRSTGACARRKRSWPPAASGSSRGSA